MTEDEAKQKWCPFARQMAGIVAADGHGSGPTSYDATPVPVFNRAEGPQKSALWPAGASCIGAACMAWRWKQDPVGWMVSIDGRPERYWTWNPTSEPGFEGRVSIRPVEVDAVGFCGLAGRSV